MNEQKLATLSIIATLLLIALAIAACMIVKPAEAVEFTSKPDYTFTVDANDVTNQRVLQEMRLEKLRELHDTLVEKYEQRLAEEEAARLAEEQAAWEAEQAYYAQSYAPSYGGGIYYAEYSDAYNTDGPSHTMPGWYDGYLETYYSDTVARHYMSDQWNVDDEGFYRDDQGRYIVGVDINEDIELGTEVETGKGTAVVMDYGSGAHVHDFYVHGW